MRSLSEVVVHNSEAQRHSGEWARWRLTEESEHSWSFPAFIKGFLMLEAMGAHFSLCQLPPTPRQHVVGFCSPVSGHDGG
uniref:Uncharacterized protein n=1 Tax=Musa balbisiana TaxID=52838 RepID=L8BSL8_MUSBA|nr:Hypothetical protein BN340_99 [Musa balbisiana]